MKRQNGDDITVLAAILIMFFNLVALIIHHTYDYIKTTYFDDL
jgi:hypothetical protein